MPLLDASEPIEFAPGAWLFPNHASEQAADILAAIRECVRQAPLRHFMTPGNKPMSVLSSNCGDFGWVSDSKGYRYQATDPKSDKPWPDMPSILLHEATQIAEQAGYRDFIPNACLINVYKPGAKMGLHQDRDESDLNEPVVSYSFGLPARFIWAGQTRTGSKQRIPLNHGDVLVWGGPSRLNYHGIDKLVEGTHPLTQQTRVNLTLRKA
ncbi:DNA oxidative demethylase AlkB [Idiomarina sp. UBA3162]|uniref:DNA oxidative demethylase AlkB n=2 Tax=unclassified Idiomarina TaxID=2614829 RepID=UPI000C899753|nr:DNA oxidative demethylase AlkB [Idiomarina sp. UBA3162]MAD54647.1 DNA oxidative demethylase AlkB [Idiomarinaceae bacterium]|tara:strand:- start:3083 stop:3712 length:630 start_codon:yes stop_codon:yes gene_type:complete